MSDNPFVGSWTYRSLLNDPDGSKPFNDLEFGEGTLVIAEAPFQTLAGTIGGTGWSLDLHGARAYGSPMHVRFQGPRLAQQQRPTAAPRDRRLDRAHHPPLEQRRHRAGGGGGFVLRRAPVRRSDGITDPRSVNRQ